MPLKSAEIIWGISKGISSGSWLICQGAGECMVGAEGALQSSSSFSLGFAFSQCTSFHASLSVFPVPSVFGLIGNSRGTGESWSQVPFYCLKVMWGGTVLLARGCGNTRGWGQGCCPSQHLMPQPFKNMLGSGATLQIKGTWNLSIMEQCKRVIEQINLETAITAVGFSMWRLLTSHFFVLFSRLEDFQIFLGWERPQRYI